MSALPPPGSWTPGSRTNLAASGLFEDWLAQSYALLGSAAAETRSIAGDALAPQRPRINVDTQGEAAADDLANITAGAFFSAGAIICISGVATNRVITVRNAVGNIVLKTDTFTIRGAWTKLWLQFVPPNWVELNRDYGQDYQQFRLHHRLGGTAPVSGEPATYTHATGEQAQAGTAQNAVMTPAAVSEALKSPGLMITNRAVASALAAGDRFLLARAGVLYQIDIGTLLAPSFAGYIETGEVTLGTANSFVAGHALTVKPKLTRGFLRCKTAELGHNANEEVPVDVLVNDGSSRTVNYGADAVNYWVRISNVSGAPKMPGRGTGNIAAITPANWRFFMRMWA